MATDLVYVPPRVRAALEGAVKLSDTELAVLIADTVDYVERSMSDDPIFKSLKVQLLPDHVLMLERLRDQPESEEDYEGRREDWEEYEAAVVKVAVAVGLSVAETAALFSLPEGVVQGMNIKPPKK